MADRRTVSVPSGRGVSDVVGFVLIFSLIIATVGIVYTTGLTGLQDARDAERLSNAETAFGVLDSNAEDILHRGAPARATEIKLSNAQIGPGEPVTVNVTAGPNASVSREITPVVYSAGDTKIVYVNGAVIRSQRGGASMLDPPNLHLGQRALVPIVDTYFPAPKTIGGQTRALVRLDVPTASDRTVTAFRPTNDTVTVTVTTTRPGPWNRYFTARGSSCSESPVNGTYTAVACDVTSVQTVAVSRTNVHVRLN
ncbi:DUF7289 family protein [Halarchaeum sp. P4]|uniref:DUF7289 family protein n=1 Tax=Halarchaeum sp. P4 TaxID=3421639 RepID=UPI003EBD0489